MLFYVEKKKKKKELFICKSLQHSHHHQREKRSHCTPKYILTRRYLDIHFSNLSKSHLIVSGDEISFNESFELSLSISFDIAGGWRDHHIT